MGGQKICQIIIWSLIFFIGENFNELISLPTNQIIIRNLLSVTDRDVVVFNNSLSLPELVQKLMDKILYGRKEIVEIISNIFFYGK